MTDYDLTNIAAGYDRARDHGFEVLDGWMREIASLLTDHSMACILDLGCGTGRFSERLAAHFDSDVIALDPSVQMLRMAREKQRDGRVHYVRGHAEAIPLASQSVDLVFISMSFHHFADSRAAARECRRVLSEQGSVVIRTGTREHISSYAYVPFFESSRSILETILPRAADVRATFEGAHFRMVTARTVMQTIAPTWTAYAEKLAAGGDSVLATLTSREFADGLAAVRGHAVEHREHPVVEPVDLLVLRAESRAV